MIDSSRGLVHAVFLLKEEYNDPSYGLYNESEMYICVVNSDHESDL